jgi:4-hydroxythreonine-4-phosphate dehydrogenase
MPPTDRPIVAVTVGEPAGVGPEIVVQAALADEVRARARVCVIGERVAIRAASQVLGRKPALEIVTDPAQAAYAPETITLVDTATLAEQIRWGKISAEGGAAAFACIRQALRFALDGKAAAVATAPIHKESLRLADVPYIDHTTMLKGLTGSRDVMTMFSTGRLRIFFLTRHIALRDVGPALSMDLVVEGIGSCVTHLAALGFKKPRLAVAALNPHGGEHGLFGTEEDEVLRPAIAQARELVDADIAGPVPADAVFHQGAEGTFDAVLSLYHDQGHIAAKTLDFHGTVSYTLGLPFLRTSVDHGTAFDIAGRGQANPHGMKAATLAAAEFALPYRARMKKAS